jgi:hypothetical protein
MRLIVSTGTNIWPLFIWSVIGDDWQSAKPDMPVELRLYIPENIISNTDFQGNDLTCGIPIRRPRTPELQRRIAF